MITLIKQTDGITPWALAAKNIKLELKDKWPHIKFSTRSDSFSMGNSVDVRWELGPTEKEVDTILDKYVTSSFDGMIDPKTTFSTPFTTEFGGSDYVNGHRKIPEAIYDKLGRDLCVLQHKEYTGPNMRGLCGEHDCHDLSTHCHQVLHITSFAEGEEYAGVEFTPDSERSIHSHWVKIIKKNGWKPNPPNPVESVKGAEMVKTKHTQKGYDLFVVRLGSRVSRSEFTSLLSEAKALGGWWSGYDRDGAIPGFQFKKELTALAFLHVLDGKPSLEQARADDSGSVVQEAKADQSKHTAERLRDLAVKMESEIDGKINSGISQQNPTARRIRIAEGMRREGEALKLTQSALLAIAAQIESGSLPSEFEAVKWSKKLVHEAMHYKSFAHRSLAEWLKRIVAAPVKDEKAEKIRKIEQDLLFASIPGYFPTPKDVVQRMLDFVQPVAGEIVLEPSAGSGSIACAINHGAKVEALEVNYSLRELLKLKGVNLVGDDFTQFQPEKLYDCVVMNPPFERGQDIEHIQKAFGHLKQGGRMAAICAASVDFRQDAKYSQFRDWIDQIGATIEALPEKTFERSGASVNTRLVLIQK